MVTTTSPYSIWLGMLLATFLMFAAGAAKKRLVIRSAACPVCRRSRWRCTCRWL